MVAPLPVGEGGGVADEPPQASLPLRARDGDERVVRDREGVRIARDGGDLPVERAGALRPRGHAHAHGVTHYLVDGVYDEARRGLAREVNGLERPVRV